MTLTASEASSREGFVGDHLEHLRLSVDRHGVVEEIVGKQADMFVLSDDDRDLVVGHSFAEKLFKGVLYLSDHQVVVVFARKHLHLNQSFLGLVLRHFLCHLCLFVGFLDDGRVFSKHGCRTVEESVVEVDDVSL